MSDIGSAAIFSSPLVEIFFLSLLREGELKLQVEGRGRKSKHIVLPTKAPFQLKQQSHMKKSRSYKLFVLYKLQSLRQGYLGQTKTNV